MVDYDKYHKLKSLFEKQEPKIVEFLESKKGVIMIIEISKERL